MYIINFMTPRYKLTASSNVDHSILNYKLMRPVRNLWLHKEQKQAKTAKSRIKLSEKSVESIKWTFSQKNFYFQLIV